jgi:hypothetical protein
LASRTCRSSHRQSIDLKVLYDILLAAYRHKGFSFVRILQRCPEWLPKMLDPWVHDPLKTLLLTHEDGVTLSPNLSKVYKTQNGTIVEYQPGARDRFAGGSDPGQLFIAICDVPRTKSFVTPGSSVPRATSSPVSMRNSTNSRYGRRTRQQSSA